MRGIRAAKKSAIFLLAALLILLAVSFLPFGSKDGSGTEKAALKEKSVLLQQLQELNKLPPAVDAKIEPAVKEQVKDALYKAAAAKSPKEAAEQRKIELLVKAPSEAAEKEIKRAGGEILNSVGSIDGSATYFAVKTDADKVAALAADNGVSSVSQRGEVYPTLDSSVPLIKADAFWNAGFKGGGVRVAVLDTGIDKSHPILKGRVAAERDFTSSGSVDDQCGHGTHVAGIVAGSKAGGGQYDGVAPEAQLLNAKVIAADSNGRCSGKVDYIIAALGWALDPDSNPATDDGAKVISMSLGGIGDTSASLETELKAAVAKGAVVVVSSGNCGSGCPDLLSCGSSRGVTWPGNSPSVITVGAVDGSKNVACFSSGENIRDAGIKPDFVAPGVDVKSSAPGGGYESKRGTSMAAPHISGSVALLLGKNPSLKQDSVKRILEKTALDLGEVGKDTSYGFGLVDLAKALAYKEGLELGIELEKQVISGATQKITVTIYDDITINSVKATITRPNNAKTEVAFTSAGGNVYTYYYTDTALMGSYAVDVAVNYGGTGGSLGAGSEGGGEAGSDSDGSSSITATATSYFKVTSLTGDFGNAEEINVSAQQLLSRNITANITFLNLAAIELNFSAMLQLLDNGTPAYEIRLQPVTVAANSKATVVVNSVLDVNPGNYTLSILTDYGAGSMVNETNLSVVDDMAPKILGLDYKRTVQVNSVQIITVQFYEHQEVSAGLRLDKYDEQLRLSSLASNYTARTISEFGNNKTVAITIYNGTDIMGVSALNEGAGYAAALQLCDESGNCVGSLAVPKNDVEFNITGCAGKQLLVVKTFEAASAFEGAASSGSGTCLSMINKSISGTPPTSYLEKFDAVVWATGTDLANIDSSDAAALADYYGKKGKVAVEGSDVAFSHGSDSLMHSVLHSELKTDLGFTVTSVANMSSLSINVSMPHPVVAGLDSSLPFNASVDPFPDAVQPYNGSVELAAWSGLEAKGSAIVAYESEDGKAKSLLLPFSIAALNDSDKKAVATGTLKWLLEDSAVDIKIEGVNSTTPAIDGQQFNWTVAIGASEPLNEMPKVRVNLDNSAGIDAVPLETSSQTLSILDVTYAETVLNSTPQAFVARLDSQDDAAHITTTLVLTGPCQAQVCILMYPLMLKPNYTTEIISDKGRIKEFGVTINTPLKAGKGYAATLTFCNKEQKCASTNELPFAALDGKDTKTCRFFKEPNAKDWLACYESQGRNVITDKRGADALNAQPQLYTYGFSAALQSGEHTARIAANSDFSIKEKNYVNNVKDFAFTVYPKLPDLALSDFAYTYSRELKVVEATVTASNLGGTAAKAEVEAQLKPAAAIEGLGDDELLQILPKKQALEVELSAGEAKNLTFTFELPQCMIEPWLCGWKLKLPSAYNFTAAIDPSNAVSEHNESNNGLSARIHLCSKERVLVVDDNDADYFSTPEPSSSGNFMQALQSSGYCAETWNEKQQGVPGSSELSEYKAVVWSAGDYFNGTISNDDAKAIGNYTGGVLLEGSDVGFDNAGSSFLQQIMAAAFNSDLLLNDSQNESLALSSHPITANISNISISKEKSPYPDGIESLGADVVAGWQNGMAAITANSGSSRKAAYYAFSVDGVTEPAVMEQLVANTVEWLLQKPNHPPAIQNVSDSSNASYGLIAPDAIKITMSEGETKNFSVVATDPDGDQLTYQWLLNGTVISTAYHFALSPKYNESGSYNLTIIVSDGQSEARAELIITVIDTMECEPLKIMLPCPLQSGVCSGSNVTCSSSGKWPSCTAETYLSHSSEYEVAEASCDGFDNDCNGIADDGFGDVDKDVIADCADDDNDNDGTKDDVDDLIGGADDIEIKGENKSIMIGIEEDKEDKGDDKGRKIKTVRINNSGKPLLQFRYNFSKGSIPLRNLTIEKQNKSWDKGFTLVRGLDLKGKTKQVFVDKLTRGSNAVCIKDKEVIQLSDVSSGCTSEDEYLLKCEFPTNGPPYGRTGWSCGGSTNEPPKPLDECEPLFCQYIKETGQYLIYGLKHSAVLEQCIDSDGDTYLPAGCPGGLDCNDSSSSISPAAAEACNGIDDNCNGQVDENRACNTSPALRSVGNKTVSENETLSFTISASDNENDALAYNATNLPSAAHFDNTTAEFYWTPSFAQAGIYAVTFNASDGLAFDYETINITVANTNRAPRFENVTNQTALENSTLKFFANATDPDNDALRILNETPQSFASAHFDAKTMQFSWLPGFNDAGVYTVKFTAGDSHDSTGAEANITVINVNRPPQILLVLLEPPELTMSEGETKTFTAGTADADNDNITVSWKVNGKAASTSSELEFTPKYNESGAYTIELSVSDYESTSTTAMVLTVQDTLECETDQKRQCPKQLGVCQDSFAPCDHGHWPACSYYNSYAAEKGQVYAEQEAFCSLSPNVNSCIGLCDELDNDCDGTVDEERACNTAPTLSQTGNRTARENETLEFTLASTDKESDYLAFTASYHPYISAGLSAEGKFTWTPNFDSASTYSAAFAVSDGLLYDTETINITVQNVNRPPQIFSLEREPQNEPVKEGDLALLKANVADPDKDDMEYRWFRNGRAVSYAKDYHFFPNYTDGDPDKGNVHEFTFTAEDDEFKVSSTIQVQVQDALNCKPKSTETAPCGTGNTGICRQGTKSRTCGSDYKWQDWSECAGEAKAAAAEDCGTLEDDDCDGEVNEQCEADLTATWMSFRAYDTDGGEIPAASLSNASPTMRIWYYGGITNLGRNESPPTLAMWYLNNRSYQRAFIPKMKPGQEMPVHMTTYMPYDGDNNATLVLDVNNTLPELNEKNNEIIFHAKAKYNETYREWAEKYGGDYYRRSPTREECETLKGRCW